jgi:hypothetical protein
VKGAEKELDDYLDWRDGGWFNAAPKLKVYIWILEYSK